MFMFLIIAYLYHCDYCGSVLLNLLNLTSYKLIQLNAHIFIYLHQLIVIYNNKPVIILYFFHYNNPSKIQPTVPKMSITRSTQPINTTKNFPTAFT